ncbi:MAG: glycosyltransferase [Niameybacter sp.]|nr:glycosyltransferase [Niameybacter sp.]
MKTVMHLLASNSIGGAEKIVFNIIDQTKRDYKHIYVCPKGPIEEYLEKEEIEFLAVDRLTYRSIKESIKRFRPNIIHAHDFRMTMLGSVCKGKNMRLIAHLHSTRPQFTQKGIWTCIFNVLATRCNQIILVSEHLLKEFKFNPTTFSKCIVLQNIIREDKIKQSINEVGESYDLMYLGRLEKEKNPIKFIRVFGELLKGAPIKGIMVGDGALRNEVRNQIHSKNISKELITTGFEENPYGYLNKSKILVMTSQYEGASIAGLEALALSKVVIFPKSNYNERFNERGVFFCGSEEEYIQTIRKLLLDQGYYNQQSKKGYELFKEINKEDDYLTTIYRLYQG